jgi:hypothetical protein
MAEKIKEGPGVFVYHGTNPARLAESTKVWDTTLFEGVPVKIENKALAYKLRCLGPEFEELPEGTSAPVAVPDDKKAPEEPVAVSKPKTEHKPTATGGLVLEKA